MAPPVKVRRAPYKDFLQPALQRRFSLSAAILLAIAYIDALLFANWTSWIWPWFPLGIAGIRTFFLFLCGLSILILRIAQYHVGIRTSNSPFETFLRNAFKPQTVEALFSYAFSGWLFSQVYLWSMPEGKGLEWITYFNADRARLNERPLYLTAHLIYVGIVNALLHLFRDEDRLLLGIVRPGATRNGDDSISLSTDVGERLPILVLSSLTLSAVLLIVHPFIYLIGTRSMVWRFALSLFRPFYNLPKTTMTPISWPFSMSLVLRCLWTGFLLSLMFAVGNWIFSFCMVKRPYKNGKPLTSESKDPNGSLLNGLKSKKQSVQAYAVWELALISRDFPPRRAAIYEDLDRKDGPMWSQVYRICVDIVKGLETRIDTYQKAGAPPPPAAAPAAPADSAAKPTEEPKRLTKPLRDDPILTSTPQKKSFQMEMEKAVAKAAVDPQQPSRLSPIAKKAVADAKDKLLAIQREVSGPEDANSPFQNVARKVLGSPAGWPFRQEFRRRINAVVLGGPYGEPSVYINAVNALSMLAVHSLAEDKYGNVQRDIAGIIRAFTSATRKLDAFSASFPMHWTDVERDRSSPEVDGILEALRDGLSQLIANFGEYSRDLKLTQTDMRLAREAAGIPRDEVVDNEMREMR